MEQILFRLQQLEAVNAVRNVLNRYMEICDALDARTDINALMSLFDEQAVWEGVGKRYQASFGRYEGRAAIQAMIESYTQKESHFVMNAHFVNSEQIEVNADHATGRWLMLQTSSFQDGRAHLNAAKLSIQFKQQADGQWAMKHFQTENIFSRPISHWESEAILPVPTANNEAQ